MNVRVRYAPSPTGYQHIGGVRTALFNYLFARSSRGTFILRVEDTDRERYHPEGVQDIYDTLAWLGLRWDEGPDVGGPCGPYVQSERKNIYQKHAGILLEKGAAYRCYCTTERLEKLRKAQVEKGLSQGYDRRCRNLTEEQRIDREQSGASSVVRLKAPLQGSVAFRDEILGEISRSADDITPDAILLKSDGFPTYHLANVVDDQLMDITHILRSQEWLPSVPLHILLYQAFEWTPPLFYHLPLVLGAKGEKLSKRHGSVRITDLKKEGYLPEALVNYICLLGWSLDDATEFFTLNELESVFSAERLNKAAAIFDFKKLTWFNGTHIRRLDDNELKTRLLPFLSPWLEDPPSLPEKRIVAELVPLVKERLRLLSDVGDMVSFLFEDVMLQEASQLIPKRLDGKTTLKALESLSPLLSDLGEITEEENERRLRNLADALGLKLGDLLMPLRVAVTGTKVAPPLFASIRLLGIEHSRERLRSAIDLLKKQDKELCNG
jgi:glutamyl-tRNA synthetase